MNRNFFNTYLKMYLSEHGFNKDIIDSEFTETAIDTGWATYQREIEHGNDGIGAKELAIRDMFASVGDSPREVLIEILPNNFTERLGLTDLETLEYWISKISDNTPLLESFAKPDGIGLDPDILEEESHRLVSRIDRYLTLHGF